MLSIIGKTCGILVTIIAIIVCIGWFAHNILMVQISANLAPMQFNTALCFLLCSINLVFIQRPWFKFGGLAAAFFAAVTLSQYATDSNYGIDTLFVTPFTQAHSLVIGRMATNTGILFIVTGILLFAVGYFNKYEFIRIGIMLITSVVIALTIVPLFANIIGIETVYPWKALTGTSIQTATCFIILSIGIICQAWSYEEETPYSLFIPLITSLLTITFAMSSAINAYEDKKSQELAKEEAYYLQFKPANALVAPDTEFVHRKSSYIANLILAFGLFTSLLLCLTVYFHILWRQNVRALRVSQERLDLAVNGTTDGLFDWDLLTDKFYFSPRFEEVLQYKANELPLTYHTFQNLLHEDDQESFCQLIKDHIKLKKPSNMDLRLRKKSGNYIWVNFRATPSTYINNKATRMTGFISDISIRNEMDIMKNEFISIVSHELRTPLTSIRGSLGLILGGKSGDITQKTNDLLQIASRNCDRLILLINDILDVEKIEAGKINFKLQNVDLAKVIQETVTTNLMYAEKFAVKLEFTALTNMFVHVDSDRLMQVLANLISNAVKFSPAGSIVKISMQKINQQVRVSVSNSGAGIPEDFKSKIFQKFSQGDSSSTRDKAGTGLGLSISKAIIEKFKGTINFTSTPNQETVFYFDLPLLDKL